MLDDFCPRPSPPTVIPASVNSAEEGECPVISNKKPKCASLSSGVVSPRNGIQSRSRSFDSETVNWGNECVTAQLPVLLEDERVDLYALSNDQDFQPPMVETSSDEKGNVDVVQLSPPLADKAENPPSIIVDQEHDFPLSPVLLAESMSPIEVHNEPTSVSLIIISSDGNKEAEEEKDNEDTSGTNRTTTIGPVDGEISPLEQSIADVQGGDGCLQSAILRSYSYSPISRMRRRRKARRRNTEPIGGGINEIFPSGSYGDLELNFDTRVSEYVFGRYLNFCVFTLVNSSDIDGCQIEVGVLHA